MRLTTIARTPLMGAMDEKFALQFRCSLKIKNELKSDIWTTSVPVVVTTNVSQDAEGWAAITWDNSFFATDRDPFTVPESVPWSHMKWVLCTRFFYQTGCHLNEQHLQYLYKKNFGLPYDPSGDDRFISWHQFAKDKGTRKFTFFTWFYEVTKLIRSHLSKEWENGLIEGFISMDEASEKLQYSKSGTFLLRFSDSTPGGISVASYTTIDNVLGIHHMTPYVRSDFDIKKPPCTIGDFIKDLFYYTHLYPNLEKDTVFCFYYTPPKRQSGPYGPKKW
ncbi:signal transducer and transcription activator-like isoform X2 [Sitodiplosis mosellana]|uniref:signal transducer and transcription activator-like isoform X2 n=1 Tax=Sitodiplosis mosellana TaxID=263140 RepID=UPI002443ACC1|nr:signal transducer and transcription activator-like isoform X2 [Sitodiplosis mosellana]